MNQLLDVLLALFLPPVAVLLKCGLGLEFLLNCVLCLFLWLPAVVHALWVVCSTDTTTHEG